MGLGLGLGLGLGSRLGLGFRRLDLACGRKITSVSGPA